MGLWSTDLFCVLHFLSVGYRLHSASLTFPEFQSWIQTIANQGREGIQKQKQSKVGTASDRVLVPTQRNMHNNVFEPPTQVEDGNFRLSTRFLEHSSVASPPTNQKGSQTLQPSPQMLPSVSRGQR